MAQGLTKRLECKKSTTFTVLRKLCQKNIASYEHTVVRALASQEYIQKQETHENVKKPHRAICLLLAAFVCICGFYFLPAKNVEAKAETAGRTSKTANSPDQNIGTTQIGSQSTNRDDDAHKFARRIVRLVKSGNKKALSKMIAYPILVHINGEETTIVDAESFIDNYNKIADKKWKTAVLNADIDGMFRNYMGYGLGNGKVWFSEQIGQEGYWIYAINNSGSNRFADNAQDARDTWENLATSQGMTKEEARRWYTRFAKEGLCETGLNFRFTGCIYDDFDKNGIRDVFVVSSLSPHEIYPESVTETMYVYGFINGEYVYGRGFRAFSQDVLNSLTYRHPNSQAFAARYNSPSIPAVWKKTSTCWKSVLWDMSYPAAA